MTIGASLILLARKDLEQGVERALSNSRVVAKHLLLVPFSILSGKEITQLAAEFKKDHDAENQTLVILNADTNIMNPSTEVRDMILEIGHSFCPLVSCFMYTTNREKLSASWTSAIHSMTKQDVLVSIKHFSVIDHPTPTQPCRFLMPFYMLADKVLDLINKTDPEEDEVYMTGDNISLIEAEARRDDEERVPRTMICGKVVNTE